MKIESLNEKCTACFACYNVCPVNAITMTEENEGFYYPAIDPDKCIECGKCEKTCPQLKVVEYKSTIKAYYGWNKDSEIRKQSSSGGVFYEIASHVLSMGGVVYGAAFNYSEALRLECKSTKDVDIRELLKSKYVQNYIGYAFREIKKDLTSGKYVLYCGTPCQIDGLCNFLAKKYDNLITCDFICHGVPSMSMFKEHLKYIGYNDVTRVDFRPKKREWVDNIDIEERSGRKRSMHWKLDEYFYAFQKYINIRRSCFNCNHCNGKRAADITLADFWGIYKYAPTEFDKNGISLILVNNEFGKSIIQELGCNGNLLIKELPIEYSEYVYKRIRSDKSTGYDIDLRNKFIYDVQTLGYKAAIKKNCIMVPITNKIKYKIKEIIKSILKK